MKTLDDLTTITCGRCCCESPAVQWREAPLYGELPQDEYQCPRCGDAWRREQTEYRHPDYKHYYLERIETKL